MNSIDKWRISGHCYDALVFFGAIRLFYATSSSLRPTPTPTPIFSTEDEKNQACLVTFCWRTKREAADHVASETCRGLSSSTRAASTSTSTAAGKRTAKKAAAFRGLENFLSLSRLRRAKVVWPPFLVLNETYRSNLLFSFVKYRSFLSLSLSFSLSLFHTHEH